MPLHHPRLVEAPRAFDLDAFFQGHCGILLRHGSTSRSAPRVRLLIHAHGKGGGRWCFDFAARRVTSGREGPANVTTTLRLSADDLIGWLRGRLDIEGAVASGAICIEGPVEPLEALLLLFPPSGLS